MNIKNKKIIITGGTGLIGKSLSSKILEYYDKDSILFLVKKSKKNQEKIGEKFLKKNNFDILEVDLLSKKSLTNLSKIKPKIVIHLAANTDTNETDHVINDKGTKNLITSLNIKKNTHIIYTSTTAFMAFRSDCTKSLNESSPIYITNEYCRTKYKAEKYLMNISRNNKNRLTILTLPTVYGKNARDNSMFDSIRRMVKDNSMLAKINWPGKTCIVHADDVAIAILDISKKRKLANTSIEKLLVYSENIVFWKLFKKAHKKLNTTYKQIKVPNFIWSFFSTLLNYLPNLEKILPNIIYNSLWRLKLILDDCIWCESSKLQKRLGKKWAPKKIDDCLDDVFIT